MLSLSPQSPGHRDARPWACRLIQGGAGAPLRHALRFMCALLLVLLVENIAVAALPLSRYREQIRQAVIKLKSLEQWAKADSPAEHASRVATTFDDVRNLVPADGAVEWEGGTVQVDNSWLDGELRAYEKMAPSDPQKAAALARITERLSALEERLAELDGQRQIIKEGDKSGASGDERKEREKERLEEILRRAEFNPQPPWENPFVRLWKRFWAWLLSLFPSSSGFTPGQTNWLAFISMIVIFGLAASVLAYAIWKLLPFFGRRRARLKLERREARVVLGERLAPDQTAADLMNEAEALARRGELRAAIRKAYIAVLCELGDRKVITLSQHKTNRDYLRALRERRNLLGEMQKLTSSFENHWYGFQQATADDWTSFRTGYQKVLSAE